MAIEAAKLLVRIQADVDDMKKLVQASEDTDKAGKKMSGAMTRMGSSANELVEGLTGINLASLATVGGVVAMAKGLMDLATAAGESELATVRLDAVYRATGGAVGHTRQALDDMTNSMMYATGMDDEMIAGAEAILLTFDQISGEAFPRTMWAAADLAATMGGDLTGAVQMLGKALQDPANGLTLLKRAGVVFTDSQRAMIQAMVDAGDTVKAQKTILDELEKKVGGVALAMGDTYPGKVQAFQTAIENLKEAIGGKLLPTLADAATGLGFLFNYNERVNNAVREHGRVLAKTTESYDEYIKLIWEDIKASKANGLNSESDLYYEKRYGEIDKLAQKYGAFTRAEFESERAVVTASAEKAKWLKREADAAQYAKTYMEQYAAYTRSIPETSAPATASLADQANEWLKLAQGIGEATRAQVGQAAIGFLQGKLGEAKTPEDKAKIQGIINDTALSFGIISEKQAAFATAQQTLNQYVTDGVLKLEEYPAALDLAEKQLDQFGKVDIEKIFGSLLKNAGEGARKLADVMGNAQRLNKMNGLSWDFYVNIHTSGSFPSSGIGINPSNYGVSGKDERRALGGPVYAGQTTLVGEAGPELVTFGQYGYVHSTGRGQKGGTVKIMGNVYVSANDPMGFAAQLMTR